MIELPSFVTYRMGSWSEDARVACRNLVMSACLAIILQALANRLSNRKTGIVAKIRYVQGADLSWYAAAQFVKANVKHFEVLQITNLGRFLSR